MMGIQFRGIKMGKRCRNQTGIKVNKLMVHKNIGTAKASLLIHWNEAKSK